MRCFSYASNTRSPVCTFARPPTLYPILWQERDENLTWRGEIVERQVKQTVMEYKTNKIIVDLYCWVFSMAEMFWWSVSEGSRGKSDFIWQITLLRHLLLYLDFPAQFFCDMKRINAFFLNSWRRHFTPELLKGYATRPVIVLFRRKCFIHCMFFSLASYVGSAIKGTVLYMADPGVNSEIECFILWLKIVNCSTVSKINPDIFFQLPVACGKYIPPSIYILKCAFFCIKPDKWKNK